MAAYIDTLATSGTKETQDGLEKTISFIVTGLTGYTTSQELEAAALADSDVPPKGFNLSGTNMYVEERNAEPLTQDSARVTVTFRTPKNKGGDPNDPELPSYEMSSSAAQVQTNADKDGTLISLKYGTAPPVGAFVNVRKPHTTLRVSRAEKGIKPLDIKNAIEGRYNSKEWQGRPPGWWLCTDVDGRSPDAAQTWNMTYTFEEADSDKLPGGGTKTVAWNPVAVYEDPNTGKPPADLTVADADDFGSTTAGIKEVPSYDGYDFNLLKI